MELENKRHERFCKEYVLDQNATRSYAVAYNREHDESSRQSGARLLTHVNVKRRIKELESSIAKKHQVTVEECIQGWRNLADFNIADIMEYDGTHAYVKDFSKIPREALDAVKSIETVTRPEGDGSMLITKMTFWDKTKARDALTRIAGAYNDKMTIEQKTLEEKLEELGE